MREIAGIIPIFNNKLVLISNAKGNFIFPKGGVKKTETSFEAAKREALEEAGIKGIVDDIVFINIHNTCYYVMIVNDILDEFEESYKRLRIIETSDYILSNIKTPKYVNEIIFSLRNHGKII